MIELVVESIRVNMTNSKRVVMLKEKVGDRYVPICIGHFEADPIAIPMQNVPLSRPLTHDVLVGLAPLLGWTWSRAEISDLADETFYARLFLWREGEQQSIDVRPSDAISVAIRARLPIFIKEDVMEKAGMRFAEKVEPPSPPAPSAEEPSAGGDAQEPDAEGES